MGKKKRADRSASEASTTSTSTPNAKKANMAADESGEESLNFADASDVLEEPNLLELKQMLIDVQISVSSVLREQKNITEIASLKESIQSNEEEVKQLNVKLTNAVSSITTLTEELTATKTELAALKEDYKKKQEDIETLGESLDNLEQYSHKNSLKIHGIPEGAYQSTEEAVLKVTKALHVDVTANDIEISHKLRRKSGNKPIIVKFCSHKVKSKLYKERTKLKNIRVSNLFPGYATAAAAQGRIYVNQNLTEYRRGLLEKANQKRKDGLVKSVWTLDGKIFLKASPEGAPIRIYSNEDLDNL